jgi:hypothetical protein
VTHAVARIKGIVCVCVCVREIERVSERWLLMYNTRAKCVVSACSSSDSTGLASRFLALRSVVLCNCKSYIHTYAHSTPGHI